ncbi:MAG: AmmeMemoRadiSam system radical SAM enzyme [bacterium]
MKEALYYSPEDKAVRCLLCPHECKIAPDGTGICRARKNISGTLFSLTYGKVSSMSMDPVEKKPLYHFYPGSGILSVGSVGCNFKCPWCQNSEISRPASVSRNLREVEIDELIKIAKARDSAGIAYTYNEPLINYEFLLECSKQFHENKLKNVLVTNGFVNEGPFAELLPSIDAANIDVKFFNDSLYREMCGGNFGKVMRTVEMMFGAEKHVELTFCVVTKANDGKADFEKFVDRARSLSADIPLHISRYFPSFNYREEPTPLSTLYEFRDIAVKKLNFVYLGNVAEETNTYCPSCRTLLIKRKGYFVEKTGLEGNTCAKCGKIISGAF